MTIKILILLGCIGHIICGVTDCLFSYTPNGKFSFADTKDNDKMAKVFDGMSLKRLMAGMLLGILALTMAFFGYLALCDYINGFSKTYGTIMLISIIVHLMSSVSHHIFCGITEWFYVKLGRTNEALDLVMNFFKSTMPIMILCYLTVAVFAVAFFIVVVTGMTNLPRWAAIFNVLPIFIVIAPTKLPAKGNIAAALMFLGLLFLI